MDSEMPLAVDKFFYYKHTQSIEGYTPETNQQSLILEQAAKGSLQMYNSSMHSSQN